MIRFQFYGIQTVFFQEKTQKISHCIPHCTLVINTVKKKKYQLNSTGMNFLFTDFLTTKSSLKIFGEYLKKLLKVLPFSKFLYDLLRMLRIECPQKCKKTCFEI